MLPRVKEPASPVELMLLNCSARCQMSYAGLVARCSGACRDLAWRCHLFIMLSSLGVERHAYAKQLAIRTQALSPDAMRRGPSLPGWTCTCRNNRNLSPFDSFLSTASKRSVDFVTKMRGQALIDGCCSSTPYSRIVYSIITV